MTPRVWNRLIALLLCGFLWGGVPQTALGIDAAQVDHVTQQWKESAHALNQVNCSSCHQTQTDHSFVAQPGYESCQSCHEQAVDTFLLGKHGIRLLEGQRPLTPAMARLPMKSVALDTPMNCNSCHDVHSVQTTVAAVDSCLSCHDDRHSLNYQNSKHAELFAQDRLRSRPTQASVSCATCHLPRHEQQQGTAPVTLVNHNNTYTLLPRDRMVKEVCMNCHGVEYSYNSIFDDALVEANFDQPPTASMPTFELVRKLEQRRTQSP
ncbi:hypothetical protein [Lyngbya confervoides]|uniref:Tetrahaem cytochrome domain-containing protein n=1 Tax=Lyngbya confervoides BDU141951 TaxID=1574623 RepID=A0ABD4T302_9CYAN|nr:hypothetical protein [Lyngbya confervoides]MCM1982602.1 hypothetical protein [Lyngbya confervoides BDU141951]